MSDLSNLHEDLAEDLMAIPHQSPDTVAAAQVHALLALVVEVRALREELADQLAPHGAIAGFLDEIGVRIASDGDSITEAIVGLRGGEEL